MKTLKVRPAGSKSDITALFILPDLSFGGAEHSTIELLRQMLKMGMQPALFVVRNRGDLHHQLPEGLDVCFCLEPGQRLRWSIIKVIVSLWKMAKNYQILIGAIECEVTYLAWFVGRLQKKPVVGCVRTHIESYLARAQKWQRRISEFVYPRLNGIALVSQNCLEGVSFKKRIDHEKCFVATTCINENQIQKMARQEMPGSLKEVFEGPVVLGVGRLSEEKNFSLLIEAHAILIEAGVEHKLVILGEGRDRKRLESLVHNMGVGDSVFLPGFFDNPYPFFSLATVLAVSSKYEGCCRVLREAQILNLPTVSVECPGGIRSTLDDGKGGLLVPLDVMTLAKGIGQMLGNESIREEYIQAGREMIGEFSPDKGVAVWLDKLTLLVSSGCDG